MRALFLEYAHHSLQPVLFKVSTQELAGLPGDYAPPEGGLLLRHTRARRQDAWPCNRLEREICEMKRLYLRPKFRGQGMGQPLRKRSWRGRAAMGYRRMRLDTVEPAMKDGVALYRQLGFEEIVADRPNPARGRDVYGIAALVPVASKRCPQSFSWDAACDPPGRPRSYDGRMAGRPSPTEVRKAGQVPDGFRRNKFPLARR